jgi:hypothetical protein
MVLLSPATIGILLVILSLVVYWTVVFVILYHLVRFGIGTQPKKIALIFLLGAIGLFFLSVSLFAGVNIQTAASESWNFISGAVNLKI